MDQLVDHCRHAMAQSGAAVAVAVDGHSAAGKSTVATHLATVFSGALVPGDDFYSVMDERARAGLSPRQSVDLYYDWRRMRDEAILPLLAGTPAIYQPYDWDNNHLAARQVRIEPASLVVVEGLFVARPEMAHLLGIAVVVEADSKTRAIRQAHRADATNDWLMRWDRAERYYLSEVRPPASFDSRISGWNRQRPSSAELTAIGRCRDGARRHAPIPAPTQAAINNPSHPSWSDRPRPFGLVQAG